MSSITTQASINKVAIPKVVFLNPSIPESVFFSKITSIMRASADSLEIDLEVVYANRDPNQLFNKGTDIIQRLNKADYLVMVNDLVVVPRLMELANKVGQRTLLFNGSLTEENKQHYKSSDPSKSSWVGSVLPNEQQAGYLVAKTLVEAARKKNLYDQHKMINIIGINGDYRSISPLERAEGLKQYVDENDDVNLYRIVHAHWSAERSRKAVVHLLNDYPDTSVIWTASDEMALGAALGAEEKKRVSGKDILTCGIDWLPVSFEEIKTERIECSVGGHIFDGAWLMILILDHFNNLTPKFLKKEMNFSIVNKQNLSYVEDIFKHTLWNKVDFRKFSKSYNRNNSVKGYGSQLLIDDLFKK